MYTVKKMAKVVHKITVYCKKIILKSHVSVTKKYLKNSNCFELPGPKARISEFFVGVNGLRSGIETGDTFLALKQFWHVLSSGLSCSIKYPYLMCQK